MRLARIFALVALVPAAVNAAPAHAGNMGRLTVPLCAGDGLVRTVSVPVGHRDIPGSDQPGCCAKGCQSGSSRKRGKGCCES